MARLSRISMPSLLLIISGVILCVQGGSPAKRSYPLPSVSDAHYQEILADGSYKYAYTGEHRYVAERRLADGTVEGESLYIRPDGVPIKVHYFADGKGYRPKTEVLYNERLVKTRRIPVPVRNVVVPAPRVREVVDVIAPPPSVVVAPPRQNAGVNIVDSRSGQSVNVGSNGGDVAAAVPSITAIVGPGAHAEIRPHAEAHSGSGAVYRSVGSRGDVAVANPQVTAVVGPTGSVVIAPKATATTGNAIPSVTHEIHTPAVTPVVRRVIPAPRPPAIYATPKVVATHAAVPAEGYVYAPPPPPPVTRIVAPISPSFAAVRAQGVLVVPPKPSYSYTYSYSAPDGKYPYRDNSAFVDVKVNH